VCANKSKYFQQTVPLVEWQREPEIALFSASKWQIRKKGKDFFWGGTAGTNPTWGLTKGMLQRL
jgi:hypothetical protein